MLRFGWTAQLFSYSINMPTVATDVLKMVILHSLSDKQFLA